MSLAILFHFIRAQHVSDINISIIRSLKLFLLNYHIGHVFLVRYVLEFRCGIRVTGVSLQHGYHSNPATPKLQHISNQNNTTNVVNQQKKS